MSEKKPPQAQIFRYFRYESRNNKKTYTHPNTEFHPIFNGRNKKAQLNKLLTFCHSCQANQKINRDISEHLRFSFQTRFIRALNVPVTSTFCIPSEPYCPGRYAAILFWRFSKKTL